MAWSRIDDSLHSHPKIMLVGNAATGLFVRLISYAGQHLTDGFVPASIARSYGTPRLLGALVDAQLLHKVESNSSHTSIADQTFQGPGYVIHDYLDYNPSRKQVEADRKKNAARQEAFRRRKKADPEQPEGSRIPSRNGVSNGVTNGVSNGGSNGAPTRPDPSPTSGAGSRESDRSSARGAAALSLITPNWQPTAADHTAAAADIRRLGPTGTTQATAKFVRHHTAKQTTAANFGPLWVSWLARERPDSPTQGTFLVGLPGGGGAPSTPTPPTFAQRMAELDARTEADRVRDRHTGETG